MTGTQLCSRLIRAWLQTALLVARELKHQVHEDDDFAIFLWWFLDVRQGLSSEDSYTQKLKEKGIQPANNQMFIFKI